MAEFNHRLKYRTRGMSAPQNKERVYFSCYPDDFALFFDEICEDIFESQNCAIWYDGASDHEWDAEDMELELGRMQLFVIPITQRFLFQPNRARDVEFPFALSHHIPVLPLMQENGLEAAFNQVCGDLQFLDKYAAVNDPTALPYAQKLKQFLSSVLVGDELAAKVRKAFDAYIFLSYRKKDRKYAQQLMRLIHQNEFCRDIAIWYDEYLVPGENFNTAIQQAMAKSQLFTLAVTPNLLEDPNYVMTTEYPEACKEGKPILPVEMAPTDLAALQKRYKGISATTNGQDASALSQSLYGHLQEIGMNSANDDPKHLFFIGLAYLSGIDVEEDRSRGAQLIQRAAESDLPEAMEKLSQMYANGEGVERDYEASAQWLERLVGFWERKYEGAKNVNNGEQLVNALAKLGRAYAIVGRQSIAIDIYRSQLNIIEGSITDSGIYLHSFNLPSCYENLGKVCANMGNFAEAHNWYEKDITACESLIRQTNTCGSEIKALVQRNLCSCYSGIGQLCALEENMARACLWLERALAVAEPLAKETGSMEDLSNLCAVYTLLSNTFLAEGKLLKAIQISEKLPDLNRALAKQSSSAAAQKNVASSFGIMGLIYQQQGERTKAEEWYKKQLLYSEALAAEYGEAQMYNQLSTSYSSLGNLYRLEGRLEESYRWDQKQLELISTLEQDGAIREDIYTLSSAYQQLGKGAELRGCYAEAREWYSRAVDLGKNTRNDCLSGNVLRQQIEYCYNVGYTLDAEGSILEAECWYKKSITLSRQYVREYGLAACAYDSLADSYYALAMLDKAHPDEKYLKKALELRTQLVQLYPEVKNYTTALQTVREEILLLINALTRQSRQCLESGNESEGFLLKEKAFDLQKQLDRKVEPHAIWQRLSSYYKCRGDRCKLRGEISKARGWYERAVSFMELLAQEMKTPSAYYSLANIYYTLAVDTPDQFSVTWLKKAVKTCMLLLEQYPENTTYEVKLQQIWDALRCVADDYASQGTICKTLQTQNSYVTSGSDTGYGPLFKSFMQSSESQAWYTKELELREFIVHGTDSDVDKNALLVCYRRERKGACGAIDRLGASQCSKSDYVEAKSWFEREIALLEDLIGKAEMEDGKNELLSCYDQIGEICKKAELLSEAQYWYRKAIALQERTCAEKDTASHYSLADRHSRLGDAYLAENDLPRALAEFEKALELRASVILETQKWSRLADDYDSLGLLHRRMNNVLDARTCFEKAVEIRREHIQYGEYRYNYTEEDRVSIRDLHQKNVTSLARARAEAVELREHCFTLDGSYFDHAILSRDHYILATLERPYDEALLSQAIKILESLMLKLSYYPSRFPRELATYYSKMGEACHERCDFAQARTWYKKAVDLRAELAPQVKKVWSYQELADAYYSLAVIDASCPDASLLKKAKQIYENLTKQFPGDTQCVEKINLIEKTLKNAP